jgi:hypothetical protein
MARVILEQSFSKPMSDEELKVLSTRVDDCLDVRDGTWRRSYVSTDRRRLTCEFEAPDAEAVREACRSADVPFERAWTAEVFCVEDFPDLREKLDKLLAKRGPSA